LIESFLTKTNFCNSMGAILTRTILLFLFVVSFYNQWLTSSFFLIKGALQAKFGLSPAELMTVWIPILEYIKSKWRNTKAKVRKNFDKGSLFLPWFLRHTFGVLYFADNNNWNIICSAFTVEYAGSATTQQNSFDDTDGFDGHNNVQNFITLWRVYFL